MENCTIANNGSIGIRANLNSTVRISNVSILNNGAASIDTTGPGVVLSFVNNRIKGNNPDNPPTATQVQQ